MKLIFVIATYVAMTCLSSAQALAKTGSLVIVGGGLKSETADVWETFISSASEIGPFVIIASASGEPMRSARSVERTLRDYGVPEMRIKIARLALVDDSATPDVNESDWRENVHDPETVALISSAAAIWFTGGDQKRTTDLLLKQGQDTPALTAIRHAKLNGAALGGTSAGAAIMSHKMILRGDSVGALISPESGEALKVGQGLGFLSLGLVDQHFGERARLGRLAKALFKLDPEDRIGFGIDENTALIVNEDGSATVAGSGYVTLIYARNGIYQEDKDERGRLSGLVLHMASAGDQIDLSSGRIQAAAWKKPTVGNEYRTRPLPGGGGIVLPALKLQDLIGEGLVDNATSKAVERPGFDANGQGVIYRFSQTENTAGFWGRDQKDRAAYSISNVVFDIRPIKLIIQDFPHAD